MDDLLAKGEKERQQRIIKLEQASVQKPKPRPKRAKLQAKKAAVKADALQESLLQPTKSAQTFCATPILSLINKAM